MGLVNFSKKLPAQIIKGLENSTIPLTNYFLTFLFAVFLRIFIEAYSQRLNHLNLPSSLLGLEILHFTLFYMMIALILLLVFHAVTHLSMQQISRVVLPSFILLLFAPLFDLIITGGTGIDLKYIQPGYDIHLIHSYLTYAGGFAGISLGIKLEVLILLIASYLYCRIKNANMVKSAVAVLFIYSILFIASTLPFYIKWLQEWFGYQYSFSNEMMIHSYLIINFFLLLAVGYLANVDLAKIIIRDMRFERIIFFELMLLLGACIALNNSSLALKTQLHIYDTAVIALLLAMISVFFTANFSIITNNIADIEIDKISNPHRPLIKNKLHVNTYQSIGFICLALAIFYALMISARAFLLITVTLACYYLYSMPPLRSKRLFLISKLAIAFSALSLLILGYTLITNNVIDFPNLLFLIFFVLVMLAANIIDLKDIAGDKAVGIKTLPIILGEKPAKIIIGTAFLLLYSMAFFLIENYCLILLIVAIGCVQFYLINKHHVNEKNIFHLSNLSIIFLCIYLLL